MRCTQRRQSTASNLQLLYSSFLDMPALQSPVLLGIWVPLSEAASIGSTSLGSITASRTPTRSCACRLKGSGTSRVRYYGTKIGPSFRSMMKGISWRRTPGTQPPANPVPAESTRRVPASAGPSGADRVPAGWEHDTVKITVESAENLPKVTPAHKRV